jgi:hypothetical protein
VEPALMELVLVCGQCVAPHVGASKVGTCERSQVMVPGALALVAHAAGQ